MRHFRFNVLIIALIGGTFFGGNTLLQAAEHCATRIAEATVPIGKLVARAPRIVLAQARLPVAQDISAPVNESLDLENARKKATEGSSTGGNRSLPGIRLQAFDVIENLKGNGPAEIYLGASGTAGAAVNRDFTAHSDAAFWEDDAVGRASFVDACSFRVDYEGGRTYLVFLGPIHVKAYELIAEPDDRWLAYVREHVEETKSQ